MQSKYNAVEVAKEMARDLVGLNAVVLRCSYGHGGKVRPAEYFMSGAQAGARIETLFLDLDVKELWIGANRLSEPEVWRTVSALRQKRPHHCLVVSDQGGTVEIVTFR